MSKLDKILPEKRIEFVYSMKAFQNFISTHDRILFSGKFGSGKTTFLDHFFDLEHQNDYFPVFIFPVNYSVSSNEDIYSLIRYDIISQILQNPLFKPPSSKLPKSWLTQVSFLNTISDLANKITKVNPSVEAIKNIFVGLDKFKDTREKNYKKLSANLDDELQDYQDSLKPLQEFEYFDRVISEGLKTVSEKKKVVLIIEDLDRIDPEHIFRILNVFSAQLDRFNYQEYSIVFQKVIIVADFENIKQIFSYRYGDKTDFKGYISKFYDGEVFNFSNESEIMKVVTVALEKYKYQDRSIGFKPLMISFILQILGSMVQAKTADIRHLNKLIEGKFKWPKNEKIWHFRGLRAEKAQQFEFYPIYKLLSFIFDDKDDFTKRLKETAEYRDRSDLKADKSSEKDYFEYFLLPIIAVPLTLLIVSPKNTFTYRRDEYPNSTYNFVFTHERDEDGISFYKATLAKPPEGLKIYEELLKVVKIITGLVS